MSIEATAHIVNSISDTQINILTIDIGVLPDEIDCLFTDLKKSDKVDFYTIEKSPKHMTKRYRDVYGNPLRIAYFDDIIDTIKNIDNNLENGRLFRDILKSISKNYNCKFCKFIIFLEEH